jgi:hypothetical protein
MDLLQCLFCLAAILLEYHTPSCRQNYAALSMPQLQIWIVESEGHNNPHSNSSMLLLPSHRN